MYEGVVQDLIDELGRLPGVGPKGAQRIAFHLLQADAADVRRLADVLVEVKAKARFCSICFNVSEDEQCRICQDPRRDPALLCVVEEYKDVVAIERTREFKGRYHLRGRRSCSSGRKPHSRISGKASSGSWSVSLDLVTRRRLSVARSSRGRSFPLWSQTNEVPGFFGW